MTQSTFISALLHPDAPVPDGLSDGKGRPAGRRFAVYRNNVAVSLTEALQAGFPATYRILGDANFNTIAGGYLRASPPSNPMIHAYGDGFDRYLAGIAPLADMPWLPDLAALELALRHAYHAADGIPLPADALARTAPAKLPALHLHLAPATQVICTPHPLLSIRAQALGMPRPEDTGEVLIARPAYDPVAIPLPVGAAPFIKALCHMPLGPAMEAATEGTDLTTTLALLFQNEALIQPEKTA